MMLKRFLLSLALVLGTVLPSFGAGSIPLSLTQQFDSTTFRPLSGGKVYFIQAGTTSTPQNAFQDSALTIPYANPYTLAADGRIPMLYFADGQIKIRITNSAGIQQFSQDNILVIGASSGGGGGGSVDPTTVLATGDFKMVYNTGTLSGFVRCNGRTIGNASSGATERANADTEALFSFLYTADTNLSVSGGRGANAATDYAANKTITLPDCKSRTLAGLSDMGASDSGRLSTTYFGCTGLVLGCAGGSESTTLTLAQLPTGITSANASQAISVTSTVSVSNGVGILVSNASFNNTIGATFGAVTSTGNNSISVTSNNTSGAAHRTASPAILVTIYLKL